MLTLNQLVQIEAGRLKTQNGNLGEDHSAILSRNATKNFWKTYTKILKTEQ